MHNVLSSSSRRGQSDVPSHSCISVRQTLLCGHRTVDPEQTARMRKVAVGEHRKKTLKNSPHYSVGDINMLDSLKKTYMPIS